MSCRGFLQCILKIINFFLTLVGAGIVLYALWMLNQWYRHTPPLVPSPAPAPAEDFSPSSSIEMVINKVPALFSQKPVQMMAGDGQGHGQGQVEGQEAFPMMATLSFVMDQGTKLKLTSSLFKLLPASWFIFAFLAVGAVACFVTCIGHIAAETASSCCLCFYIILLGILLIVQGAVTATVFFDNHWKQDLPADPTGQLDKVYSFIIENFDIIKWVALVVLILEALALLFSLILRALTGSRKSGYDSDDDYLPRTQQQSRPQAQRQATSAGNGAGGGAAGAGDGGGESRPAARNDEWSVRMRKKYGLDTNEFSYNPGESRRFTQQQGGASTPASGGEEKKGGCCTIM